VAINQRGEEAEIAMPRLMVTCLRGGKANNSKVKFTRFGFVLEGENVLKNVRTLYGLVRKQLASGKQGEAGLKFVSGSFLCMSDTINDSIKVLEEAIKNSGLTDVKIFITCNANNFYNETTGKYEMEGAKSLFDSNQFTEYFIKFLNDHPLVTYLEDPMSDKDFNGWRILTVNYKD
jgi:enolase